MSIAVSLLRWFDCLFSNTSETPESYELKFLEMIPIGMQIVLGLKHPDSSNR